jgi:hypothetical protein
MRARDDNFPGFHHHRSVLRKACDKLKYVLLTSLKFTECCGSITCRRNRQQDGREGGGGSDENFNLLFRLNRGVGAEGFVRARPHTCLELQYVTL